MSVLYLVTGLMAGLYGGLLLWSAKHEGRKLDAAHWLTSDEGKNSPFNKLDNMRFLIKPERKNISFSRSKSRAYMMLVVGIVLVVMAFT